ncbi:MAG TPA: c-type cytochrome [Gammaproteobacteria bacterium]|nr:c-type cytochrome [Gammaproteobacteria bacterium]
MRQLIAIIAVAAALQACAAAWGPGFHFPDGDVDRGREAFVALRCHACHTINGFDPPSPIVAARRVRLGGHTARVKTYGDIVTSIVNPSHRIARGYPTEDVSANGESLMSRVYLNEILTVQQLIDLVAFLQTEYELIPPPVGPP